MRSVQLKMADGYICKGTVFEAQNCQSVLQIIHGAKEHKQRYFEVAQFLCDCGISVYIFDARGHGESVSAEIPLGHMPGYKTMIHDIYEIYQMICMAHPSKRIGILAHSLGSVFARCLIQEFPVSLDYLILSGVANYVETVNTGLVIAHLICKLHGRKKYNKLLIKIGDSSGDEWVCKDEAVMAAYRADPMCSGYYYTNGAITTVWEADAQLNKTSAKAVISGPILFISGDEDPVTGGPEGLASSEKYLRAQGYSNIRSIVYPGMKHEVLNETQKHIVWDDVLNIVKGE